VGKTIRSVPTRRPTNQPPKAEAPASDFCAEEAARAIQMFSLSEMHSNLKAKVQLFRIARKVG
jgi:hypothetical protein